MCSGDFLDDGDDPLIDDGDSTDGYLIEQGLFIKLFCYITILIMVYVFLAMGYSRYQEYKQGRKTEHTELQEEVEV